MLTTIDDSSVDLIISLFAGFIWEPCQRYLKPNGYFLANESHADFCIALLDTRLTLISAIEAEGGRYLLTRTNLDGYINPKNGRSLTREKFHRWGRGIVYGKSAFAYVFHRIEASETDWS